MKIPILFLWLLISGFTLGVRLWDNYAESVYTHITKYKKWWEDQVHFGHSICQIWNHGRLFLTFYKFWFTYVHALIEKVIIQINYMLKLQYIGVSLCAELFRQKHQDLLILI